jgi:hypothetical protein
MNRGWAFVAAVTIAGCHPIPAGPARLFAADSAARQVDVTMFFILPDSGGFLVNGVAVPRADIPAHVAAFFESRSPATRAVMVWDNPRRRSDAQWLAQVALAKGGRAFDAALSGWPHEVGVSQ